MPVPFPVLLCLVLVVHLVVDQLDGGVAAVEWNGTDIAFLPAALLPAGTSEGDRLVVRVRRRPRRARTAPVVCRTERSDPIVDAGPAPGEELNEQEGKP